METTNTTTPAVPMVTITATYSCDYFPDECGTCGAEVDVKSAGFYDDRGHAAMYPADDTDTYYCGGDAFCPNCGHVGSDRVNPANDPADWGGYCDPSNPWSTLDDEYRSGRSYNDPDDDPIPVVLPVYAAAEFLAQFPGGVWDATESEAEMGMTTGVWRRVTAHVDGPGATAALEIFGNLS